MKTLKKLIPALLIATTPINAGDNETKKEQSFPHGVFRAEYSTQGRAFGLFNYNVQNNGVFIESKPFKEDTYLMKGKINVEINAYVKRLEFDLDIFTKYDAEGKPLKSVGVRRKKNYQMTSEMHEIAKRLEEKGLLENIDEITALYYQKFDYEEGTIKHVGNTTEEFELNGNKTDILTTIMDYVTNIEKKPNQENKGIFFYGDLHDITITKKEHNGYYKVNVNLQNEEGKSIVRGFTDLELKINKETKFNSPNTITCKGLYNLNVDVLLKSYTTYK